MPETDLTDHWKEMEARFAAEEEHFNKEWAKSKALPEGLQVGKLFRLPHADGYAFYEVVKINKTTVRVKWRPDLCPDKWMDNILGEGGSFPIRTIEPIILREEGIAKLFATK